MPDREKVIKGLECCASMNGSACRECPYSSECVAGETEYQTGTAHLAADALDMLKEQEAYKPKGHWMPYEPDKRGYTDGFTCSRCERVISSDHYCKMIDFDFCPYCGAHMDNAEGW